MRFFSNSHKCSDLILCRILYFYFLKLVELTIMLTVRIYSSKWNKVACEFNRWFKVGNRVLKQAWWSKPFDHQKVMRDTMFYRESNFTHQLRTDIYVVLVSLWFHLIWFQISRFSSFGYIHSRHSARRNTLLHIKNSRIWEYRPSFHPYFYNIHGFVLIDL